MSTKTKFVIGGAIVAVILVLIFIPPNDFFGLVSHNEESPAPMMVLENTDDIMMGLKIIPVSCSKTTSGLTESHFEIANTNEKDYNVMIDVSFTKNDAILYEKQVNVEILSGETINQNHLSDNIYDNPICVVKIVDFIEI